MLPCRELDEALGLSAMAGVAPSEARRGKNTRHLLTGLLRQSVYGRLAGYEDVNDAERLCRDPVMRAVVDRKGLDGLAASSSQIGRFETGWPASDDNLAARYMEAHVQVNCRPATVETYERLLRLYILPELVGLKHSEVDRSQISALHYRLRDKPVQANKSVLVLSKMFKLAVAWGMTPARPSPCRSVKRYRERNCERFLTGDEYARLGRVLFEAESEGPLMASAVVAIRLLLLTGCRKNEILMLRWDDIDRTAGELRLRDSKSGPRRVPMTPAVERVLAPIPRAEGNPWVIAGLDDVRLHDCRHSFASQAPALGEGLPTIARLLGHKTVMTTYKYAHPARDTERASAATVGDSIGNDLAVPDANASEAEAA